MSLLEVQSISKKYGDVEVLKDITFALGHGESLGIVGGSGSGKSTLIKCITGIEQIQSGKIFFDERCLHKKRKQTYKDMQIILQDPSSSLNPKLPVRVSMMEPYSNFHINKWTPSLRNKQRLYQKAVELGERVGIEEALLRRLPHELSGGQKQRISIARGISLHPKLLILDEPTSSLDVSVQAQILNLLKDLQNRFGMAFLFISHDIAAVRYLCEDIMVMNDGAIVETFKSKRLLDHDRHDYTKALIKFAEG
ncbi:ABC transporter ATP-binding protein [Pseudalkalibacillus sp. Hm43]|uniref:ABC transporter ATP-binding protein n=1 Tax=Pseudalkalibacillus sp. Hm43 TaxID=3450742 RepID=UPI003F42E5EB